MRRSAAARLGLACLLLPAALRAQATRPLRIVISADVTAPVPGLSGRTDNVRMADLLFLRLARYAGTSVGDRSATPELARSWTRRDARTLVFELDPRARWHDGVPVTAEDVLFTFRRARDPEVSPAQAVVLREVEEVRAEGRHRVVVRFRRAYPEQLFDATWHAPILPAHLLAAIPPDSLPASAFVKAPVGSGPYRWVRREPGQFVELQAVPDFFLGRPVIDRVVFRVAADPSARLNLLLAGEADLVTEISPPTSALGQVAARDDLRTLRFPTYSVGYALFNQRANGDTARPHPILADPVVRRALVLALDRGAMLRAVFGPYGQVPGAPVPMASWVRPFAPTPDAPDTAAARRLLASRGWSDHDGDGVLDRDGTPLRLVITGPASSWPRVQYAAILQEQWRRIGVQAELAISEGSTWEQRRNRGQFDVDLSAATQDPYPSGLVQSWTCAGIGGSNVARFCDPAFDSLLARARYAAGDVRGAWAAALHRLADDHPAVFLYAFESTAAYAGWLAPPDIRPESYWTALRRWRPAAGSGR